MNIPVPKPTTVHQCHWQMRDLGMGMGGQNGDCGANKRQKMSIFSPSICLNFPSLKMTHHQHQQQHFPSPTAPSAVVYQQQRGQHIPSNGAREQFEFIDGTAAGSNVEEDRNNNKNNDAKQRQFPASSTTSSPIPHQLLQQGEPHRLIAREMSTGDIHTQEENAKILFGPFFRLTKPFFADEFPQRRRIVKRFFFVVMSLMLVGRAIYYFSQIGKSMNLSLDWARASLQVSLTLNALGAIGWMHKNSGFPRQFVRNLLAAIGQNRRPKCSTGTILGAGVISIFFIFTSAIWALMRILELQLANQVKTMPAANNSNGSFNDYYDYLKTNESNGFSIETIYKVSLTCLDAFLALLSGVLGALALAIFHLSFQSVLAQWKEFKKEQIDENIENGRLNHPETLNRLSISASALLRFAHSIGNQFEQLGTGMFMTAIFCNISATFIGGVTGIKESSGEGPAAQWPLYELLEKVNNFSWSILSIILLVITLKGPYNVHSKIREIKEQLLLEDSLWTGNDEKLTSSAKNFIQRLSGIRIHRIGTQLFQLVFIAQMVLVWLLISGSNSSTAKKI